jgi:uncharacterized membrane protein HdeD (DUF308 family)
MYKFLSQYWWVLVVRGAAAILFGVLAFILPMESLAAVVVVFGAYALIDGMFASAAAIAGRKMTADWWILLLQGLVSIGVGVVTYMSPAITAMALLFYIALGAVLVGALQIVAAVELRYELTGEWWLVLGGIVGMVFGALLVLRPTEGALTVLWLIATFAIVWGVMLMIGGFDVHRLKPTAA